MLHNRRKYFRKFAWFHTSSAISGKKLLILEIAPCSAASREICVFNSFLIEKRDPTAFHLIIYEIQIFVSQSLFPWGCKITFA